MHTVVINISCKWCRTFKSGVALTWHQGASMPCLGHEHACLHEDDFGGGGAPAPACKLQWLSWAPQLCTLPHCLCVRACMQGINCTVCAYGQTGSGKTHTMFGPARCAPVSWPAKCVTLSRLAKCVALLWPLLC